MLVVAALAELMMQEIALVEFQLELLLMVEDKVLKVIILLYLLTSHKI